MPDIDSNATVPNVAVGKRELAKMDLSPLGLQQTDCGCFSLCDNRTVEVVDRRRYNGGSKGESRLLAGESLRPMPVPVAQGIAVPFGQLIPLDVLVAGRNHRSSNKMVAYHMLSGSLPKDSLYRVSDQLLVASPELTIVQLCHHSRLLPTIELCLEWGGTYALPAPLCIAPDNATQLVTKEGLQEFLRNATSLRGADVLRRAMFWAADNSASPRETELYLVLVLPKTLGGFGFPQPEINAKVELKGAEAGAMTSDSYYLVDLLYRSKNVVVEYDGFLDHETSAGDVGHDKERRSVLAALGYTVIVVTKQDVRSVEALEKKALQIATALEIRLDDLTEEQARAREALCSWLFNSRHDHLPFGFGYC